MFDLVVWTLGMAVGTLALDIVLSFGQALKSGATGATAFDPSGHRPKQATAWVNVTMASPSLGRPDHVFQETGTQRTLFCDSRPMGMDLR